MGYSMRRMRRAAGLAAVAGVLLGAAPPASAQAPGPAPLSLARLLDAVFHDGKLVMTMRYQASVAWAGADRLVFTSPRPSDPPRIMIQSLAGTAHVLAQGSAPVLSDDGRWLAYIAPDGELAVAALDGERLGPVTRLRRRPEAPGMALEFSAPFAWRTGGHELAYLAYGAQRTDAATLGAVRLRAPQIRVFDPATGADRLLYSAPDPVDGGVADYTPAAIGGLAMAADGTVVFSQTLGSSRTGLSGELMRLHDGKVRPLARIANDAGVATPYLSPDGRVATLVASKDPPWFSFSGTDYRAFVDLRTGRLRLVDRPYVSGARPAWVAGGRLLWTCKTGALMDRLCRSGPSGGDVALPPIESLADVQAFAPAADGRRLAWLSRDVTDTVRLKVGDADGRTARVLWADSLIAPDSFAQGETRVVRWRSYDGLPFEGLLTLPPGYHGGRLPLVVEIHGGSNGGVYLDDAMLMASPLERQMWAGLGYAFFSSDYRAGMIAETDMEAFRRKPGMIIGEADARDVLAGVDAVVDSGVADPDRLAVIGHSAGAGALTGLLLIDSRFKAAVLKEGLEDFSQLPGPKDPPGHPSDLKTRMFLWRAKDVADLRRIAAESSIPTRPEKVKTPVLVIRSSTSAERIADGKRTVAAVKAAGGEAEGLFFPDDYHVTVREPNTRKLAHIVVDFIARHVPATPVAAAAASAD